MNMLCRNKGWLDCSIVQLDSSHTSAKNGGVAVGYQGRKKARTTTALFLADNQGQPLACATPQAGNHHDSFQLAALFEELCMLLEAAGIAVAGLFLNAESAFDTTGLRQVCAARHIEANHRPQPPRHRLANRRQPLLRPRTLPPARRGRTRQRLARQLQNPARALLTQRWPLAGLSLARIRRPLFVKN